MSEPEMTLRVPGEKPYLLVIRTALGGVAIIKDLDADTLDDLRMATDTMYDCLTHQGRKVQYLDVAVYDEETHMKLELSACFDGVEGDCPCQSESETEITRAVLQTLASEVYITRCGEVVQKFTLLLHKASAPITPSND